jgi:uncharacterized membrane protein
MLTFLLGLVAPALWAATNHFDKYIIERYFKSLSVGAMLIFSALIGVLVVVVGLIFGGSGVLAISPVIALLTVLNGWVYLLATLPYLKALKISDASTAIPMFQIIPVISFVLAWLVLGETLSSGQVFGGLLILLGAVIISLEFATLRKVKIKAAALGLMFLSSVIFAVNFLLFKVFALENSFWTTAFWEGIGFVVFGALLLVFVGRYRRDFVSVFRKNRKNVIGLNAVNEVINIVAKLIFNQVSLLMAITLAWIATGFQPVFVLIYSIILARFFPKISNEAVWGRHLVQKSAAIGVMLVGIVFIGL